VHRKSMTTPIDFVFCSGYFLEKVKNILLRILIRLIDFIRLAFFFIMQMGLYMLQDEDIYTFFESKILSSKSPNGLDLKKENYFSAAIGQARTKARYVIDSAHGVVDLLHKLAVVADTTMTDSFSDSEIYEPRDANANENSKRWINSVRRRKVEIGDTGQIGM